MRADIKKLRRALGSPKPPKVITQEPYEGDHRHLYRLARGDWRTQLPKSGDLSQYVEDINWGGVIQPELFRYMLPGLLEMWRRDLTRENRDNGGTVEWLYGAMARRRPVKKLLGDRAEEAAGSFMGDAILDRIDNGKQLAYAGPGVSPYDWISALASLGAMFPVIGSLWRDWWRLDTAGQAIALLQYVSELIYDFDNPLFPLWTPEIGGGPPCLWEPAGHIYKQSWLSENVEFLSNTVTADYVEDGVRRAADKLRGTAPDDLLDGFVRALPAKRTVLEKRVAVLPEILSRRLGEFFDWDAVHI